MQAIELADRPSAEALQAPVLTAGRTLDDALDFDFDIDAEGALDLDCLPSSHGPIVDTPRWSRLEPPIPRRSSTTMAAVRPSQALQKVDTHSALVAFSGFGDPPAGVWGAPAYAVRVIRRRRALKSGLARARQNRAKDVGLYEASLRTADDAVVRKGIAVLVALGFFAIVAAAALARVAMALLSVRG